MVSFQVSAPPAGRALRFSVQEAVVKLKSRVHELTHRNNPKSMERIIEELNSYLRGWAAFFRVQEYKRLFGGTIDLGG